MAAKFVTEKELEDEKKRRQEEWDRVRQPGQPEEAPELQDTRPLYDRLKQQRDQKQLEFEETHKLKNLLRGLDSEEVDFLEYVDKVRHDEQKKRLDEERALLSEVKKRDADATADSVDQAKLQELTRKPIVGQQSNAASSKSTTSKQAQLLAGVVKKRKVDDGASAAAVEIPNEKKIKTDKDSQPPSSSTNDKPTIVTGVRISATRTSGGLPGLESYDSDDSSNDSSDTDEADSWGMVLTTPVQLKLERHQQQKQNEAKNVASE